MGILKKWHNHHYICDKNIFKIPAGHYTLITQEEFHKILDNGKNHCPALLKHFLTMIKSMNWQTGIGFTSLEKFATIEKTAASSINMYTRELVDLGLIYTARRKHKKITKGFQSNYYCRPENKAVVDRMIGNYDDRSAKQIQADAKASWDKMSDWEKETFQTEMDEYAKQYPNLLTN